MNSLARQAGKNAFRIRKDARFRLLEKRKTIHTLQTPRGNRLHRYKTVNRSVGRSVAKKALIVEFDGKEMYED